MLRVSFPDDTLDSTEFIEVLLYNTLHTHTQIISSKCFIRAKVRIYLNEVLGEIVNYDK